MSWYMLGDERSSSTFWLIRRPARITSSRISQWPFESVRATSAASEVLAAQPKKILARPSNILRSKGSTESCTIRASTDFRPGNQRHRGGEVSDPHRPPAHPPAGLHHDSLRTRRSRA
eukprot:6416916-Heterocapsa_arctica.AAC.1